MKTFLKFTLFLLMAAFLTTACNESSDDDENQGGNNNGTEQTGDPNVSNFAPTSGKVGDIILIRGENFGTDKTAQVNSVKNTRIEVVVPEGEDDVLITVTIKNTQDEDFTYTPTQTFSYTSTSTGVIVSTVLENLSTPTRLRFDNIGDMFVIESTGINKYSNGVKTEVYNVNTTPYHKMGTLRDIFFASDHNELYVMNEQWVNEFSVWPYLVSFKRDDNFTELQAKLTGMVGGMFGLTVNPIDNEVFMYFAADGVLSHYNKTAETKDDIMRTTDAASQWFFGSLMFSKDGKKLYVAQYHDDLLSNILVANYNLDTKTIDTNSLTVIAGFAGFDNGATGYKDGTGTDARFNQPVMGDFDSKGNLYIADSKNHCIRKITPEGIVTTIAGTGSAGYLDGDKDEAMFNLPTHVQFGADGALYVTDSGNNKIRKITL